MGDVLPEGNIVTTQAENFGSRELKRAHLLKYGAAAGLGLAVLSPARAAVPAQPRAAQVRAPMAVPAVPGVLDLYINEGYLKMVDDSLVYHRGFGTSPTNLKDANPNLALSPVVFTAAGTVVESRSYPLGAQLPPAGVPQPASADGANSGQFMIRRNYWASYFPKRTIIAEVGSTLRFRIHNRLAKEHRFTIHGAGPGGSDVTTGAIAPSATAELNLACPPPGSYIFSDPSNAPVERVLGLFGAIVVIHPNHQWDVAPGLAAFERQWIWLCHDIDPVWAEMEATGKTVNPQQTKAVPRYFTLNGRSGYESLAITKDAALNLASEEETLIAGFPRQVDVRQFGEGTTLGTLRGGQLVRLINPGIVHHQMHFHGNHIWLARWNNRELSRDDGFVDPDGHVVMQQWEDVVELSPMHVKDCILPMKRPPDAVDQVWLARTTDWVYPMHCHAEPSQTAAGGMYPGGLVAHWTLKAPSSGASS